MDFMDTFKIHYYTDGNGQAWVRVNRRDVEVTMFKHYDTELTGELVTNTRTRFTDTSGGLLPHPHILAITPQKAIGEAMKVMVDRAASQIDPHPFERAG